MTRVRGLSKFGAAAGLACLAIAVAAPASADDLNMTTCTDQQVMSSIQQNDPLIWGRISSDQSWSRSCGSGLRWSWPRPRASVSGR